MKTALALAACWLVAAVVQTVAWRWQQRHGNAGIVDVAWTGCVGVSAIVLAVVGDGAVVPRATMACIAAAWSLRLGAHLWRRVSTEGEDGRYAYLRVRWGNGGLRWFVLFQLQALLVVLFALPFVAVSRNPQDAHACAIGAVLVWVVALAGERRADARLARFRADPANRGKTCREGLWRYSRHPNYFFEWVHWFAYVLLAVGSPIAWLAWSGPLVMFVFLRWGSGVPFTEAQALRTRGEDYRAYQRTTSAFFPWFPGAGRRKRL